MRIREQLARVVCVFSSSWTHAHGALAETGAVELVQQVSGFHLCTVANFPAPIASTSTYSWIFASSASSTSSMASARCNHARLVKYRFPQPQRRPPQPCSPRSSGSATPTPISAVQRNPRVWRSSASGALEVVLRPRPPPSTSALESQQLWRKMLLVLPEWFQRV